LAIDDFGSYMLVLGKNMTGMNIVEALLYYPRGLCQYEHLIWQTKDKSRFHSVKLRRDLEQGPNGFRRSAPHGGHPSTDMTKLAD
jgi:hypothetical protein